MVIPLRIVFRNIPPSEAVEAEIRQRAEKLEQFSDHVMRCDVTLKAAAKHKHQGRLYEVRIDITAPRTEIAISRGHRNQDPYVAIRDAFEAAIRKLQDYVRHQRREVKAHEEPKRGRVTKLFQDGYGFIETADGSEFYFDRNSVVHPDFDQIDVGTEVEFLESAAGEGLQAKRVSAAGRQQPPA